MTDVAHASPAPAQKPLLRPPRRLRSPQQRPEPSVVAGAASPRETASLLRRRRWERRYARRLELTDSAVITGAVTATLALAAQIGELEAGLLIAGVLVVLCWLGLLKFTGTRSPQLTGSGALEYTRLVRATLLTFGLLGCGFVVAGQAGLRPYVLLALPLGLIGLVAGRWCWRQWLLRQRRTSRAVAHAVVVGSRSDIDTIAEFLGNDGSSGYLLVGSVVLDSATPADPAAVAAEAARLGADTIVVGSRPYSDPRFVKRLAWQLEGTAAELVLSHGLTDVAEPRISLQDVEGLPLVRVRIPTYDGGQHIIKRAFDVAVATLALVPIAAVTPLLALAIRLDSPGPVLFWQDRVGRDGRTFRMVKFRTMTARAEQDRAMLLDRNDGAGPLFKLKDDPRITRVGRILRRYSLDELPQFWNVLRGDMSVVGPRPPLPSEVTAYDGSVVRRLYVRPGITGPWQVSGRSDLAWEQSVRLDLHYVENWSLLNDLILMWRTVNVVVRPEGAY